MLDERIEIRYEDENIWLTQKMMAVLYDVNVRIINYHIKVYVKIISIPIRTASNFILKHIGSCGEMKKNSCEIVQTESVQLEK